MADIQRLLDLLNSDNHNKRYDACEELRVSRQPLPQEAIDALNFATNDINPEVADAAQRALSLHAQIKKQDHGQEQNEKITTREELWAMVFPLSILLSLGSTPWLIYVFFILGLGGWALKGVEAFLGSIIGIYMLAHPVLMIVCPIISWYFHKKNEHAKANEWALTPIAVLIIVAILYFIISARHPAWG